MVRYFLVFLALLLSTSLAGCQLTDNPPAPLPTDTPQPPTQTPTPTTVWFPPTATFTPLPTSTLPITPTVSISPVYGELLLADNFEDPKQWATGRTGSGSIGVQNNELTLAISRPNGYLSSLRAGTKLGNFYAEITASPTLCREGDEYGLLLRVSPGEDFYRLSLTCDGQIRLDKYYQGKASSPRALTPSGAVPPRRAQPDAPGRIGRWQEFELLYQWRIPIHRARSIVACGRVGGLCPCERR